MKFSNCNEGTERAEAYATLGFARTYYLAYRDLLRLLSSGVCRGRMTESGASTKKQRPLRRLADSGRTRFATRIALCSTAWERLSQSSKD